MEGQAILIDLYPDEQRGTYAVEVQAGPKDRASTNDLPARSGDLWHDTAWANPDARRLTFTPIVPGPFGNEPLTGSGRLVCAYLYQARDEAAILALAARIMDGYAQFY